MVVFLGAGPNYASALFGAAKLFEGAQLHGVTQNTEEWAHTQYFISGPSTRTVLLAPRGRSLERAFEIATEMRFIETPFLAITDDAPERWQALTPRVLALPAGIREPFSPLLFAVPLSQLGYHLAKARGKQSYNFPSAEREREHYRTLHESVFRDMSVGNEE
jgi:glucosamine 6-phosphate synthetase-like amidotransferase/phosphosugar isomerase protein